MIVTNINGNESTKRIKAVKLFLINDVFWKCTKKKHCWFQSPFNLSVAY